MSAYAERAVVVTGAGRGIGRATAALLAAQGWRVVGLDREQDGLRELAAESGCATVVGDVCEPAALERAAAEATRSGAELRGWVNNVGINHRGPLVEAQPERIEEVVRVNLVATILGCRTAITHFLAQRGGGAIVNLSSIHGRAGFPDCAVYDATKGGVEALTRSVAVEYGRRGIRCNAVAPGAVATEAVEALIEAAEDPAAMRAETEDLAITGRISEPTEIAEVVAFLLSDAASSVHGQVVGVDGGASARVYPYPTPGPEEDE